MADDAPVKDRPAKQGSIGKTLSFIFRVIGILLFSATMSIIIEWIGMSFYYPDEGYHHAENMMYKEMEYFSGVEHTKAYSEIGVGNLNGGSVDKADAFVKSVMNFFLAEDGVLVSLSESIAAEEDDGDIIRSTKAFLTDVYDYIVSAMFILVMFFIRLAILFLSLPAFILFGVVGISDGLMQRDLRRWCGGNESAFIYHWAKRLAVPVLAVGWILYLAIPTSIHPNYIITPFAVLFGLVLMVMSSKFKKYL